MNSLRSLIPLLFAAGILLAGNGLQGTLIAVRGAQEGFSPALIGFMGTAYFGGFLIGCMQIPRLLGAVGHIRVFAALAAIAASATLMLVLVPDGYMWVLMRFLSGICFSGLFSTMESWINSAVQNQDRGRVLSIYRIIDVVGVTGAQYMLPIFGSEGFILFGIMTIMITLSLVPVSLADRSNPTPPAKVKLNLKAVWNLSPIAAIGTIAIGMTNASFRLVGPIYGQEIGMSITQIATFMGMGIIGGAFLQYPLGYWSDRWDRRKVLIVATAAASASSLSISILGSDDFAFNLLAIFLFGAFAIPLYSLTAAHANDRAEPGQFVQVAAALMLFYGVGAMMGPPIAAGLIEAFGPRSLFAFISSIHGFLILATLYRMQVRIGVPNENKRRFTALLRTSAVFVKLTKRGERH